MELFTRTIVLQGTIGDTLGAATDIRAYASERSGHEIGLWAVGLGAPFGTMSFSTVVEGLAGAAEMNASLLGDAGYEERAAKLRSHMVGTAETQMMTVIHGQLGQQRPPVGSVATITTAVAAGHYDKVVGFGVEVSQHVESVTGIPMVFGSTLAGPFGQFSWIGVSADAKAADDANAKLMGDATYIEMISGAGDLFVHGASHRMIGTRVA